MTPEAAVRNFLDLCLAPAGSNTSGARPASTRA
jgi:hypothetical protein